MTNHLSSGGNTIAFARQGALVVAVDIDARKLRLAAHNAAVYRLAHRVLLVRADFLALAAAGRLRADVVFVAPPWGGPDYRHHAAFRLQMMDVDGRAVLAAARQVSDRGAILLPRNVDRQQLAEEARRWPGRTVEVEENVVNGKVKTVTAYFGLARETQGDE